MISPMPPTLETMAEGYVQTALLFCAIEVDLAGIMGDCVLDVEEIVWRGGFSSETLRAWKTIGIVAEPRPGGFCLTEAGSSLVLADGNALPDEME